MEHNIETVKREFRSFVETFFSFEDAVVWIEGHLRDYKDQVDYWHTEQVSINLMPSGAYRAGFVVSAVQGELNV